MGPSYSAKPQYHWLYPCHLLHHCLRFLHWTNPHGQKTFPGQIPMVTGSDNSLHGYCKQRKTVSTNERCCSENFCTQNFQMRADLILNMSRHCTNVHNLRTLCSV